MRAGYADTNAGEGLYGVLMEQYGFPALLSMNLTTIALVSRGCALCRAGSDASRRASQCRIVSPAGVSNT